MPHDDAARPAAHRELHPAVTAVLWLVAIFPDVILWLVFSAICFLIGVIH
ncbi:MAG TPA: hypothetical protein VIH49_08475 [Solirubrobacteraceae bacterium]